MRLKAKTMRGKNPKENSSERVLKDPKVRSAIVQLVETLEPHVYNNLTKKGTPSLSTVALRRKRLDLELIADPRVQKIACILKAALDVPPGIPVNTHVDAIAKLHGLSRATVFRYLAIYKREGLVGLRHRNRK
jgi:hypothetical protein